MVKRRVATAVIGLPLVIAAIWFGTPWFTSLIVLSAIAGSLEFYRMATAAGSRPMVYLGVLWTLLLVISSHCPYIQIKPILITTAVVVSLVCLLFRPNREQAFARWAWTMAGILYIGWMLSYWVDLRSLESGRGWVLWAILTVFANDIFSFFGGRAFGKRRLAPAISPGKTWEGAAIGVILGMTASFGLSAAFSLPFNQWQPLLLGAIICILAQLGDLVESLLKRTTGAKDSGGLLPGHGGLLDRADSLILTGVFAYYWATLCTTSG